MDVWINSTEENKQRLIKSIDQYGLETEALVDHEISEILMFHFGDPPNVIEITNRIARVKFEKCYSQRNEIIYEGINIRLISLNDLKVNKLKSGRLKDLNDLEELNKFENE